MKVGRIDPITRAYLEMKPTRRQVLRIERRENKTIVEYESVVVELTKKEGV